MRSVTSRRPSPLTPATLPATIGRRVGRSLVFREVAVKRLHQTVLIVSTVLSSWLGMQAVHESGHVLGAWLTGGRVARVVLNPLTISRTDLDDNPRPLVVVWAGPLFGVGLPLLLLASRPGACAGRLCTAVFRGLLPDRQRGIHRRRLVRWDRGLRGNVAARLADVATVAVRGGDGPIRTVAMAPAGTALRIGGDERPGQRRRRLLRSGSLCGPAGPGLRCRRRVGGAISMPAGAGPANRATVSLQENDDVTPDFPRSQVLKPVTRNDDWVVGGRRGRKTPGGKGAAWERGV